MHAVRWHRGCECVTSSDMCVYIQLKGTLLKFSSTSKSKAMSTNESQVCILLAGFSSSRFMVLLIICFNIGNTCMHVNHGCAYMHIPSSISAPLIIVCLRIYEFLASKLASMCWLQYITIRNSLSPLMLLQCYHVTFFNVCIHITRTD